MHIVSNDSIHNNLQYLAASAISDIFAIVKAFLCSILYPSDNTIVSSCFNIINTESFIIYCDDDIDYLSIIANADDIKSQYIKYLTNEKVDDDTTDRMLSDANWIMLKLSRYFEGFHEACIKEIIKIISNRRDGLEKKKELIERVNNRKEETDKANQNEEDLQKYELPPVNIKLNSSLI